MQSILDPHAGKPKVWRGTNLKFMTLYAALRNRGFRPRGEECLQVLKSQRQILRDVSHAGRNSRQLGKRLGALRLEAHSFMKHRPATIDLGADVERRAVELESRPGMYLIVRAAQWHHRQNLGQRPDDRRHGLAEGSL